MRKLWVILCLVGMSSVAWAQESSPRVSVLPFAIHSRQDTVKTQKTVMELLVRRLEAEGVKTVDPQDVEKSVRPGEAVQNEEQARALGRRLGADYVVTGSLNEIGNSISLDARLVDVSARKKTEALFAEEKGMENLAAAANQIVQQMAVHLLARAVISEVVIQGNERIEAEAIKSNVKSKKGELLRSEQVAEDIKAIYKMGYFEKVDANVTDTSTGKLLTFVVLENPTIQEVRIKGNNKIKEKDILAAISTRQYTVLQKNVIAEDVQKILKLYSQKGYFNAEVKPRTEFPKDPRKATVVFDIDENKKVYIQEIAFTGNKSFSSRKLRSTMQVKEKSLLSLVTDRGILQKDILETDVDRLTVFYHDKGFMDAKVGTPEITRRDDGFYINIPVDEGERYKVTSVKLQGDLIQDEAKIQEKLKSKPEEYFSREKLREDIDVLNKSYMNEGYAYVQVEPNVQRHSEEQTSDITYNVKKGDLIHIGRIYVTGNTKTRDKVIRRELQLAEGDTFSSEKMEQSITKLKKLDFFEEVEIAPSKGDQADIMNLTVKVKEKLTGAISVGGGFASDDGLFASSEIIQRNLFGRGQTLGVKGYFGQDAQRYVASFTEPWLFDRHIIAGIDVYNWLREYNDFTKDATGVRLRTGYPFGNYSRLNVYYTLENADVTDVDEDASAYIKSQEGKLLKSSITVGMERDTTDHPFMPTRGSINAVSSEFSSQYLGSDTDFIKSEVKSGWYFPIYWKLVGFVKGEFGYIDDTDPDKPVPVYENFFLGGINSLRAFKWGDVGPKDEQGEIIGGRTYGLATVEMLFPLIEKLGIRGVGFFDAGNVYTDIEDFSVSDFRTDAGAGIRWSSPFGPLRIEWGYNLDPEPGEDRSRWQFSAGAFF